MRTLCLEESRGISPIKNGCGAFETDTAMPRPRIVRGMAHSRKTEKSSAAETWGVWGDRWRKTKEVVWSSVVKCLM